MPDHKLTESIKAQISEIEEGYKKLEVYLESWHMSPTRYCHHLHRRAMKYAFDCPIHGLEIDVLCWRAFQKEDIYRWRELKITGRPLTSEEQKELWPRIEKLGGQN